MANQRVVLVTGASNGIGRAVVKRLAEERRFHVFGTSREPERVEHLQSVTFLPLDVTSADSVKACIGAVLEKAGQIDVLINNAGVIGPTGASEETDLQQARALFETNFFGVVQMTNAVLPVMRAQGRGSIINISSAVGLVAAPPFLSFYVASKHALEGYTETLRYEVHPFGIQVALIEPGFTNTPIVETIQPPIYPIAAYEDQRRKATRLIVTAIQSGCPVESIAQSVLRILASPEPQLRHVVGVDTLWITALKRILPPAWFQNLIAWMFLGWKPSTTLDRPDQPDELGLHKYLFHGPTMRRTQRAGLTGLAIFASLALGWLLFRKK